MIKKAGINPALFLLIFSFLRDILLRINVPDSGFITAAAADCLHCFKRGCHRMIHIIISVLPVSADAVKIIKGIEIINERGHFTVSIKICGICLFNAFSVAIQHVSLRIDNAHFNKL
jgi:hypothetical protein